MGRKFNFKNKSLWKKIGIGTCCGVLGLGAIMGVGALLNKAEETTTKNINPTYAVGGLTEDGKYLETKGSIYTKNAFECQGLDIDFAFNNNVSYRVFFYDNDGDFILASETLTDNYDEVETPINADTARIVITPNEDDKISWYEVNGYAKQLEIEVNKEQDKLQFENKAVIGALGTSGFSNGTYTITARENYSANGFEEVDVKEARYVYVRLKTSCFNGTFADGNSTKNSFVIFGNDNKVLTDLKVLSSDENMTLVRYNVSQLNSVGGHIHTDGATTLEIYVI